MTDYPPLTSTAIYPLHGWNYGTEYACKRPEDPACMTFDWRCGYCILAAQASVQRYGDTIVQWRRDAESAEVPVQLSWLIARSLYWLNQ